MSDTDPADALSKALAHMAEDEYNQRPKALREKWAKVKEELRTDPEIDRKAREARMQ